MPGCIEGTKDKTPELNAALYLKIKYNRLVVRLVMLVCAL